MSCPHTEDAAAYVIGALSPAERFDFQKHLAGCPACERAVRELAGMPGLLGRVEPSSLEHPPSTEPVPDTLLPALSREVRSARRRRVLAAGAAAAAVAAVITAVALGAGDTQQPAGPETSSQASDVPAQDMEPVGHLPVTGTLSLEPVTWGTRLGLNCLYARNMSDYPLPRTLDLTVFVRTEDGAVERVGSWRAVSGMEMKVTTSTAVERDEISQVQVRNDWGKVVLELEG